MPFVKPWGDSDHARQVRQSRRQQAAGPRPAAASSTTVPSWGAVPIPLVTVTFTVLPTVSGQARQVSSLPIQKDSGLLKDLVGASRAS
jgi:hypothetical protein